MAEMDEKLERAKELMERAQGFLSDAEFREEHETKQIRYLQAMSNSLVVLYLQNELIVDLLKKQQEYDALAGD